MRFNPDKCEVLIATNKKSPIHSEYTIHGQVLNQTDSAKYLGLNIHKSLSWDSHIDKITKKANSTLAFLGRIVSRCPTTINAQCYTTLVRPNLGYASSIWSPSKKTASTRLRQYNVEPPDLPLEITSAQAVSQPCYSSSSSSHYKADKHHLNYTYLRTRGHSLRFLVPHT